MDSTQSPPAAPARRDPERMGVKISIAGSFLLASSAVIMALVAKSQAILLDGLYTFITLIMAFVSLKVIDFVEVPETSNRPFGYMALEPFLNLTKSLIVLTLLGVFLITNIQEIVTGGRLVALDMMSLYIFICLIIYAVIILLLRKYRKETDSSILALEIRNWCVDALLTLGIAVSLGIAFVLYRAGYTTILPYIDPSIVIGLVVLSLPVPIRALIDEGRRLLLVSSENSIEQEAKEQLQDLIAHYGLIDTRIWGLKSGRTYYIFVYTSLRETHTTLEHLDEIRAEIFRALSKRYSRFWADIMFTTINPETPAPQVQQLFSPHDRKQ